MILGRYNHVFSACLDEIDAAISALDKESGRNRNIVLNAHEFPAPEGSIIYNLENYAQLTPAVLDQWADHEVWDFSASNCAQYGAKHVPIGYHPSMERFKRDPHPDIDVVFTGSMNKRRAKVLDELRMRGFRVVSIEGGMLYGKQRDAILARARVALNMLFYEGGMFPSLRVSHLVANKVPVISERCPEGWGFVPTCDYDDLVSTVVGALNADASCSTSPERSAEFAYQRFTDMPMRLP